jgi:hypothetical protein
VRASLDECEASSSRCRGLASSIESTSLGLTATNGGDSQGGKDPSDRSPSVTTAVATWWPPAGRFRWLPAEDLLTFVRFPSGPAPHQEGSCKQAPSVRVVNYLGLCLVGTASQSCRPAPPLHPWTRGGAWATVGVLGSIGTALLTWSATRWRVRTETRTEHARWPHQVRRDAYVGLLTSARTATSALLSALETLHANREQEAQQLPRARGNC